MANASRVVGATAYRDSDHAVRIVYDTGETKILPNEEAKLLLGEKVYTVLDDPKYRSALKVIGDYDKVIDAYADINTKHRLLEALADQATSFEKGKEFYGDKVVSEDIPDAIYNFPKILFEPAFRTEVGEIGEAFSSVDEIRLPFPKITIITCVVSTMHAMVGEDHKIDTLVPIYLSQQDGYIRAMFVTNKRGKPESIIFNIVPKVIAVDGRNQMPVDIHLTEEQRKAWTPDKQGTKFTHSIARMILYVTARVLYMMTFSGGDVYMSKPTKEEAITNAKRVRKGKKPLLEFRLIKVDGKTPDLASLPQGTHASPRLHWRRGHWRTMKKSGKKVWIDPMLVGDEENGKIVKDYAVGKYEEEERVHH